MARWMKTHAAQACPIDMLAMHKPFGTPEARTKLTRRRICGRCCHGSQRNAAAVVFVTHDLAEPAARRIGCSW